MVRTRASWRAIWQGLWLGLCSVAMVLMMSACGGGSMSSADAHSAHAHSAHAHSAHAHSGEALMMKAKSLPDPGAPSTPINLPPGGYVTDRFKPSMSFNVGKGWAINFFYDYENF